MCENVVYGTEHDHENRKNGRMCLQSSTMSEHIEITPEIIEIRHYLHAHPERSFKEYETSAYIEKLLRAHDIEVLNNPLETGVVGLIRGDQPGPRIALRADIDGLPIQEDTGLPFSSVNDGVMHGCGHDLHMSYMLGAAFWLAKRRKRIRGSIKLLFQPAEELGLGAKAMVDAFAESADAQIIAFVSFVEASNLATHLRSQDWLSFASGYNGDGQAPVYARKIESAYRRQTRGVPSATVLRLGSSGEAVKQLQESLVELGFSIPVDGSFGQRTLDAVKAFQNAHGLKDDGVVGALTQRELVAAGARKIEPPKAELSPTENDAFVDKVIERGTAVVGTGGLAGLLGALDETAQQLLIGGVVVGGLVVATLFFLRRRNA